MKFKFVSYDDAEHEMDIISAYRIPINTIVVNCTDGTTFKIILSKEDSVRDGIQDFVYVEVTKSFGGYSGTELSRVYLKHWSIEL